MRRKPHVQFGGGQSEKGQPWHLAGCLPYKARDLLVWLKEEHADLLDVPVALVKPGAKQDGVVFELDHEGEAITDLPLYRIERRQPTVLPL